MGSVSYSAHISNGKSAITSKSKLQGVAKHNLRKYKSDGYSSENIILLEGTENTTRNKKDQNEELKIILNMLLNWIRIWRWKLSFNVEINNFGKSMKKVKCGCKMYIHIYFLNYERIYQLSRLPMP